jgi:hypothetical protein
VAGQDYCYRKPQFSSHEKAKGGSKGSASVDRRYTGA